MNPQRQHQHAQPHTEPGKVNNSASSNAQPPCTSGAPSQVVPVQTGNHQQPDRPDTRRNRPEQMAHLIFRTPVGLAIRMTGENPHAAEAQGLNPMKIRYGAIIVGSALMGMGGAFLTLSAFNSFFPTMVQGRGWICIALVVFSSWRPGRALFGALLFAFFDAFQLRLQTAVQGVPYQIFLMTPYILSIVALAVMSRRARVPQALMQPYRRGER